MPTLQMLPHHFEMKPIIRFTILRTIGFTINTVGKATTNENAQAGSHSKNEAIESPIWWTVTIPDTMPDIKIDKKKLNRYGEAGCCLRASVATGILLASLGANDSFGRELMSGSFEKREPFVKRIVV